MRVYRVAHRSAVWRGMPTGPYSCSQISQEAADAVWGMGIAHCDYAHPSPFEDRALHTIREDEFCGFDSRDALNTWFDEWTTKLADADFIVWEYEVPDWALRVGRRGQVVFVGTEAVEVARYEFAPEQMALFA